MGRQRTAWLVAFGLALASGAPPALANPTPIVADVAADWEHGLTGVHFPATLAGFRRARILDFATGQLDIAATYELDGESTTATLYVYRAGLPDVSVWHDRIRTVIGSGRLGTPDWSQARTTLFDAPGGAGQGLSTVVPMTAVPGAMPAVASAVAVFRTGDWLVVVRLSSATLDAVKLAPRLAAFTAAIPLKPGQAPASDSPPVYEMAACTAEVKEKQAARAGDDMSAGLLGSALMAAIQDDKDAKPEASAALAAPQHYCRDSRSTLNLGIYQGTNGYVLALGDAGVAALVHPDYGAAMLGKTGGYVVELVTTDQRAQYRPFKSRPALAQIIAVVNGEKPATVVSRPVAPGEKTNITIGAPK